MNKLKRKEEVSPAAPAKLSAEVELLTELANGAPCPVVLIRQPNGGAPAALNRGLAIAHGDYVAILNSDDAFAPTRIETLLAAISAALEVLQPEIAQAPLLVKPRLSAVSAKAAARASS